MEKITLESPSVHSYLTIIQSVISRMAANSSSCKTWCITLVSAIVVIISKNDDPNYVWIAIIPILLFFFLDTYYLSLERQFREVYNSFIRKLHHGEATVEDVFYITPKTGLSNTFFQFIKATGSISIWPFYTLLIVMLFVIHKWVLES